MDLKIVLRAFVKAHQAVRRYSKGSLFRKIKTILQVPTVNCLPLRSQNKAIKIYKLYFLIAIVKTD